MVRLLLSAENHLSLFEEINYKTFAISDDAHNSELWNNKENLNNHETNAANNK